MGLELEIPRADGETPSTQVPPGGVIGIRGNKAHRATQAHPMKHQQNKTCQQQTKQVSKRINNKKKTESNATKTMKTSAYTPFETLVHGNRRLYLGVTRRPKGERTTMRFLQTSLGPVLKGRRTRSSAPPSTFAWL